MGQENNTDYEGNFFYLRYLQANRGRSVNLLRNSPKDTIPDEPSPRGKAGNGVKLAKKDENFPGNKLFAGF
jgi:hypothetical protein